MDSSMDVEVAPMSAADLLQCQLEMERLRTENRDLRRELRRYVLAFDQAYSQSDIIAKALTSALGKNEHSVLARSVCR